MALEEVSLVVEEEVPARFVLSLFGVTTEGTPKRKDRGRLLMEVWQCRTDDVDELFFAPLTHGSILSDHGFKRLFFVFVVVCR